jgi:pseudolysin
MHNQFIPSLIVVLSTVSVASASVPFNVRGTNFNNLQQQFHISLPGKATVSITNNEDALKVVQQHTDQGNITHVRMQQQYLGFDVIGGYVIAHSLKPFRGQALANSTTMNGIVYNDLNTELGQPPVDFVKNGGIALQSIAAFYKDHAISEQSVEPVVYIDARHNAHWAYKVSFRVNYGDKIPAQPTAFLDAKTFKPFIQWNDIKTAMIPVKGKGFGGNSKIGEYAFGGNYPYLDISRDDKTQMCYMENPSVKVVDLHHQYSGASYPMTFACIRKKSEQTFWTGYQADGYDRENGAFSPANDALFAGHVIEHIYKDWYGVNALSKADGSPLQLVMRVHFGQHFQNAFWDDIFKNMTFGDGAHSLYPLVSTEVVAHEVSHGFTSQHSNLIYNAQSGGMNEAFSDMAAKAAEFSISGKNHWMIGAEITKEASNIEAMRYMDLPSRDGFSIDSADQYNDDLDVHYSSGVFNRLFYLIANSAGWDTQKAFMVMIKANMDYWTPSSTFEEGACGILNAAADLQYRIENVKKALDVVKIDYITCCGAQAAANLC